MVLFARIRQFLRSIHPLRIALVLGTLAVLIPLCAVAVRAAGSARNITPLKPVQGPQLAALSVASVTPVTLVPAGVVTHKSLKIHMMAGNASWYGSVLQGHTTASGAIFDENQLTAAHRTLPFGTFVKVIDLRNRKTVVVKITDRGVLYPDRAIDLSHAAAEQLNMVRDGVHPVRLQVIPKSQALAEGYTTAAVAPRKTPTPSE